MPAPKDPIKRARWKANMSAAQKGKPSPKKGKTVKENCKNPEAAIINNREAHLRYHREHPNPARPTEVIPGQIPLTRNLYALCDLEDYEELMKHTWGATRRDNGTFHAQTIIDNQIVTIPNFLLHLAPGIIIDHIDRNPLNNHRSNLRPATEQENNWNRGPNRNCSSRFKGVGRVNRWWRAKNPWQVMIMRDGRSHYLGRFLTEEAAARAYDAKARELFGEFAYLNFPEEEL